MPLVAAAAVRAAASKKVLRQGVKEVSLKRSLSSASPAGVLAGTG